MAHLRTKGFTIIETMLFLAISGALAVAILVTSGVAINTQRYRDAVVSLQTEVQDLYFGVQNVSNDREQAVAGCVNTSNSNLSLYRGQSQCVIVGKYYTINGSGDTARYTVIGQAVSFDDRASDDLAVMRAFNPRVVADTLENGKIEWGARLSWPREGAGAQNPTTPRSLALLVMRSPLSGASYTFTSDTVAAGIPDTATLRSMIIDGRDGTYYGTQARTVCVEAGEFSVAEPMAIYIGARASTSNAIEVRTNNLLQQFDGPGAPSC